MFLPKGMQRELAAAYQVATSFVALGTEPYKNIAQQLWHSPNIQRFIKYVFHASLSTCFTTNLHRSVTTASATATDIVIDARRAIQRTRPELDPQLQCNSPEHSRLCGLGLF